SIKGRRMSSAAHVGLLREAASGAACGLGSHLTAERQAGTRRSIMGAYAPNDPRGTDGVDPSLRPHGRRSWLFTSSSIARQNSLGSGTFRGSTGDGGRDEATSRAETLASDYFRGRCPPWVL